MERTLIGELGSRVGQDAMIQGVVDIRRDQGKMAFFDFRDRSGTVQGVVFGKPEVLEIAKTLKVQSAVSVFGKINKRPEKMVNAGAHNGDIEIEITKLELLGAAEALPFELDTDINIDTLLDYRPLTLRRSRERAIFSVQAAIVRAYRDSLAKRGFMEFQAPALVGSDAEGGAEVFKVEYFNDKTANLATSPQLYKQIMTGVFERVFTIAKIFRAEKSATTRHIAELTQMDFEMGFIKDEGDVMATLEAVVRDTVTEVVEKCPDAFKILKSEIPALPEKSFPVLTLRQVQETLGAPEAPDLEPEQERKICEWAKEKHGSDFVFVTRFPTKKRAFYTYEATDEAPYSRGFDLLFRGLEINSGAQRIHDYEALVAKIRDRGMDPEKFSFYLQAFKYGMPPHGGCSTGLERFTMKMLNLENVKEATPFPRDMGRIDKLLSQ
jgi:nondiscriminating aspartyl-tRNA synthetase